MATNTKKQQKTLSKNGRNTKTNDIHTHLNTLLADEHVLYVKTRDYHWNVQGLHFAALHGLFEQQYETLKRRGDLIAEQVRKLEGKAIGSMQQFLDHSRLTEQPGQELGEQAMIKNLLFDHESIMETLEDEIEFAGENADEGTVDMLVQTLREHQEMAWMLRSMAQ